MKKMPKRFEGGFESLPFRQNSIMVGSSNGRTHAR